MCSYCPIPNVTGVELYRPLVAGRLTGGTPRDLFHTYLSFSLSLTPLRLVLGDGLLLFDFGFCAPLVKGLSASVGAGKQCTAIDHVMENVLCV